MTVGLRRSIALLAPRDRRRYFFVVSIQAGLGFLDLFGVVLIGVVSLRLVDDSSSPPANVPEPLTTLWTTPIYVLASAAAVFLIGKSITSLLMLRFVLKFLARRQANVSRSLMRRLLSSRLLTIRHFSSQQLAYALTNGVNAATVDLLGQASVLAAELSLLVILATFLFAIDPLVACVALLFFFSLAFGLHRALAGWATRNGRARSALDIASIEAVQESLSSFREIFVLDRRNFYLDWVSDLRRQSATYAANSTLVSGIPKYFLEIASVLAAVSLAAYLAISDNLTASISVLAVFIAAATRLTPSILRLQTALLSIRNTAGLAAPAYELDALLPKHSEPHVRAHTTRAPLTPEVRELEGRISVSDVTFVYNQESTAALSNINLEIEPGQSIALVGRSGAGKSTLVDCMLGILEPTSGSVTIDGVAALLAPSVWPGSIACIPQTISLANSSVRYNVALGLPDGSASESDIWNALEAAHLSGFVASLPRGIETEIGEGGVRLSGGQRQRLGIARALLTKPRILFLDEATSSLDAETEAAIGEAISRLRGSVTTISVAHRLATIRAADVIHVLESGHLTASGAFSELIDSSAEFNRQASHLGMLP